MLKGFLIHELQADEIRTLVGPKKRVLRVLTIREVWSRLWVSAVVSRHNFRHSKTVILNTLQRGIVENRFLVVVGTRICRYKLQIFSLRLWGNTQDSTTLA